MSASHNSAADCTNVSSTSCSFSAERLMTLSTSAVAVCCCSDSRSSLSNRAFSIAMTAWAANLLVGERPHLLTIDRDLADELVLLEHGHVEQGTRAREIQELTPLRVAGISRLRANVRNLNRSLGRGHTSEAGCRTSSTQRFAPPRLGECRRCPVQRYGTERVSFG